MLVELTESLVKALALDKESVTVKTFETDNDNLVQIEVLVSEEDMGRVIGKGGKNASAIRTLVQAASYLNDDKRVKINIDSF